VKFVEAHDSKGDPVAKGDSVVVRGRVVEVLLIPVAGKLEVVEGGAFVHLMAILKIDWESDAPLIDYVKSTMVTKE
jgi:hypothetical protein